MGVTEATGDAAVDVTYSTKPNQASVSFGQVQTSTTTLQPQFTTSRVLPPIVNSTVRPVIVRPVITANPNL